VGPLPLLQITTLNIIMMPCRVKFPGPLKFLPVLNVGRKTLNLFFLFAVTEGQQHIFITNTFFSCIFFGILSWAFVAGMCAKNCRETAKAFCEPAHIKGGDAERQ